MAHVRTRYKRKDKKIRPANVLLPTGVSPDGKVGRDLLQSEVNSDSPRGCTVPRGSRLIPEHLVSMNIGGDFLSNAKKQLFVDILFKFEGAIAFDDSEMGLLSPEIEPPVVIHTIPHTPWQQQNIRLPKAMQEVATKHVKEKLANGCLNSRKDPVEVAISSSKRRILVNIDSLMTYSFSTASQFMILACLHPSTSSLKTLLGIRSLRRWITTPDSTKLGSTYCSEILRRFLLNSGSYEVHGYRRDGRTHPIFSNVSWEKYIIARFPMKFDRFWMTVASRDPKTGMTTLNLPLASANLSSSMPKSSDVSCMTHRLWV